MKNKLTILDAMKYPNAKIKLYDSDENFYRFDSLLELIYEIPKMKHFSISDCKLILRPLESLTEEEKSVYESLYYSTGEYIKIPDYERITGLFLSVSNLLVSDYLRSINIDIDGYAKEGKGCMMRNENKITGGLIQS